MHQPHHVLVLVLLLLSTPLVLLSPGCRDDPAAVDPADTTGSSTSTTSSDTTLTTDSDPATTTDTGPTDPAEATCGDGIVSGDEACDDGTNDGEYGGCMPDCTALAPHCGDGTIDPQWHERCDHGAANGETECNRWCQISGTKLGELSLAPSWGLPVITRTGDERLFLVAKDPDVLWEIKSRADGALVEVATTPLDQVLQSSQPPTAIAEFAPNQIALVERGMLDDEHVLHVFDVADAISALWEWSTHSPLDPLTGQTTDLIVLDSQLWLLGDARDNASAVQQLWVHRFDVGSPGRVTHDLDEWMGGTNALVPRGVFDPTSGYVALFAAHAGASASHMRISLRDPQTGEEILSTFDYAYDRPLDVCARPDGGLLVLASEAGAPSSRLALGYRIGQDGALEQDGELALDFAWASISLAA